LAGRTRLRVSLACQCIGCALGCVACVRTVSPHCHHCQAHCICDDDDKYSPLLLCASAGNLDAQRLGSFSEHHTTQPQKALFSGPAKKEGGLLQDCKITIFAFRGLWGTFSWSSIVFRDALVGHFPGILLVLGLFIPRVPAQAALPFAVFHAVFHHRLYCIARTGALVTPFYSLFPARLPSLPVQRRCEGLSTRTLLSVLLLVVRRRRRSAATTPAKPQRNRRLRSLSLFTRVHFHRGSPARVNQGGWWVSHDGTHGWRCNPAHGTDRIYTTSNPCVRL